MASCYSCLSDAILCEFLKILYIKNHVVLRDSQRLWGLGPVVRKCLGRLQPCCKTYFAVFLKLLKHYIRDHVQNQLCHTSEKSDLVAGA